MSDELKERIEAIEQRNSSVEANKRWETSWIRRISIAILTYATVLLYSFIIGADNIFLVSLVPVMGFMLSTLSLQFIRATFEKREQQ